MPSERLEKPVFTLPGVTFNTLTPQGFNSARSESEYAQTANLVAQYAPMHGT
jgi:hypothetical protein